VEIDTVAEDMEISKPIQLELPFDNASTKQPEHDQADANTTMSDHLPVSVSAVLYTIGHSNVSDVEFLDTLKCHEIGVLIDVRSKPYSRHFPQFNKQMLETLLKSQNIEYRFAGEYLGGRPDDPSVYKTQQLPDQGVERTDFLDLVQYEEVMKRDWYSKGVNRLLEVIHQASEQGRKTAIMCSEGDPSQCHRHYLIARSLVDSRVKVTRANIEVRHILKDGTIQVVDESVFAHIVEQPRLF
jgi:hypothetical protein